MHVIARYHVEVVERLTNPLKSREKPLRKRSGKPGLDSGFNIPNSKIILPSHRIISIDSIEFSSRDSDRGIKDKKR